MSRPKGSTRLDWATEVPDEASEKDRQRIEQVRRNVLIRRHYPKLKAKHGWQEARRLLAERFSVSPHTVKKVLDGKR